MAQAGSWATDARLLDGYDAVNCLDYPMPRTAEGFAEIAEEAAQVAPDIGAWNTYTYFDCAFWPAEPTRVPGPLTASGAPPILVVAADRRPIDAVRVGRGAGRPVGVGHPRHASRGRPHQLPLQQLRPRDRDRYLLALTTPADGTTCD